MNIWPGRGYSSPAVRPFWFQNDAGISSASQGRQALYVVELTVMDDSAPLAKAIEA